MTTKTTKPILSTVELVRRYGGPISHAALDPNNLIFHSDDVVNGLITFRVIGRCAVVFGDPICAPENSTTLADAFSIYCDAKGWSIVYSAVSSVMQLYAKEHDYTSIEFAELMMTNPQQDPEMGHPGHHLRQHLNLTRRAGVTVREYFGLTMPDILLEEQLEAVSKNWLATRQGVQLYLGRPRLFDDKYGRRWFVAEQAGSVIGMLSMLNINCLGSHNLINLLLSSSSAPLYTRELMIASALRIIRNEGSQLICLSVGPLPALKAITCRNTLSRLLSSTIYRLVAKIMNFRGRALFWKKFNVIRTEPMYLVFNSSRIGLRQINALFWAFNLSVK
ncbi:MAG: hypothetical protein RIQ94_764 [Pseudomonadota bacterium]|jgi:lysylphosphatidylglycerol synthetase-like protein (DUF2156 family)